MTTSFALTLAAIVLAALIQHLVIRTMFHRLNPRISEHRRRFDRAKSRFEELHKRYGSIARIMEEQARIMEEEGCSIRPLGWFMGGVICVKLGTFLVAWIAFVAKGGPLAVNIWWVGVLFSLLALVPAWVKVDKPDVTVAQFAYVSLVAFAIVGTTGLALYFWAPLGAVAVAFASRVVGWIGWRVAPHRADDLPAVARMLL